MGKYLDYARDRDRGVRIKMGKLNPSSQPQRLLRRTCFPEALLTVDPRSDWLKRWSMERGFHVTCLDF